MKRNTAAKILALLLTMSMMVSPCVPACAEDNEGHLAVNPDGQTIDKNTSTGEIDLNNGEIITNEGTVKNNRGDIQFNNGEVSYNYEFMYYNYNFVYGNMAGGVIKTNDWEIDYNFGEVTDNSSTGIVKHNEGDVRQNNGTVITNEKTKDTEGYLVDNNGTVEINRGGVTRNTGIIGRNEGNVEFNVSTITTNTKDGRINGNAGTLTNPNEGYIGYNNANLDTNSATGRVKNNMVYIGTNEGFVERNWKGIENWQNARIGLNKPGATVMQNDDDILFNNGAVTTNNGSVNVNTGTVTINTGTVTTNSLGGIVETNDGTVESNLDGGTVITNQSLITANTGTVTSNTGSGVITTNTGTVTTNASGGTITTNNGTVTTNDAGGTITENNSPLTNANAGTITANNANLAANGATGTITANHARLNTNAGTVEENSSDGEIVLNNGTVETNAGTIWTNKGLVAENNGTVAANDNTIGTVDEAGHVTGNTGEVQDNYPDSDVLNLENGIVENNYGNVYNYGGTVGLNRNRGTEYFPVGIVNASRNITITSSGLKQAYGQTWLGQTAGVQSTATIVCTPKQGYEISEFQGLSNNVSAEELADGSWRLTVTSGVQTTIIIPEAIATGVPTHHVYLSATGDSGATLTGAGDYAEGETVTLSAVPSRMHGFVMWEVESGDVTIVNHQFTMPASDVVIVGRFDDTHRVYVSPENDDGAVLSGEGDYIAGTTVTLTAQPGAGHYFKSWHVILGDVAITNNQFTMPEKDVLIIAMFGPLYETQTEVTPAGVGTAAASPASAPEGAQVTLTATPDSGYHFKEWRVVSGDITIENNQFTMPAGEVAVTAVFEGETPYRIISDGAAVARVFDGWSICETTQAVHGERVSLTLSEDSVPQPGQYFTREYAVDGVSLGREYDDNGLSSWPVTNFTMPDHSVNITAAQAPREPLVLDFSQSDSLTMDYVAWVQLQSRDDVTFTSGVDLDNSGTPDLAVTEPDWETTSDFTLTLLPEADAVGTFAFPFTDNRDRFSPIVLKIAVPSFGPAIFTMPSGLTAIEAGAFEGDTFISIVDAPNCTSIGAEAFKGCTRLTQIRVNGNCQIDDTAFTGCGTVYVFAPAGGDTETWCDGRTDVVFVEETPY